MKYGNVGLSGQVLSTTSNAMNMCVPLPSRCSAISGPRMPSTSTSESRGTSSFSDCVMPSFASDIPRRIGWSRFQSSTAAVLRVVDHLVDAPAVLRRLDLQPFRDGRDVDEAARRREHLRAVAVED